MPGQVYQPGSGQTAFPVLDSQFIGDIAQLVYPAALLGGIWVDRVQGLMQSRTAISHYQLAVLTCDPSFMEIVQKRFPFGLAFIRPLAEANHLPFTPQRYPQVLQFEVFLEMVQARNRGFGASGGKYYMPLTDYGHHSSIGV